MYYANYPMTKNQNCGDTIDWFVASDSVFSFMSSVTGAPAYWKQFLYDVLGMVRKQSLGIPTYFVSLFCADLSGKNFHIL